jgi:hypothetical protein
VVFTLVALACPGRGEAAITRTIPGGYQAYFELAQGASLIASPRGADIVRFAGEGATVYDAHGSISKDRVDVDFGALAHVHVRFAPSGPPTTEAIGDRFCRGGTALSWKGTFTGSVRIRAKYGLSSLRTRTFARSGTLEREPRLRCHYPDPKQPPPRSRDGNQVQLLAAACDGRSFSASVERPTVATASSPIAKGTLGERAATFSASATLNLPGVSVTESISKRAPPTSFVFDDGLTTASVSPPPPFHGTATLAPADGGGFTWTGSLSATILGRPFSLAGPGFQGLLESFHLPPGTLQVALYEPKCSPAS